MLLTPFTLVKGVMEHLPVGMGSHCSIWMVQRKVVVMDRMYELMCVEKAMDVIRKKKNQKTVKSIVQCIWEDVGKYLYMLTR